ncbi:phosphatase PAP2 family protein [Novosphingobium umbonatum]|uniref:Phosphatase PAP2 family protein n=1 Tax=Novosphingobium umbonatum TaxID=1908524 RepID=A0A437N6Y1_9SPHN|nr:phosphatase PAP2 family protein [Novosphingobium umbonatum]RVU05658.1 phosphatase PAP2 family protein [Novosphingobium umbonatum]
MTIQPTGLLGQNQETAASDPIRPCVPLRWLTVALMGSCAVVAGLMVQNQLGINWRNGAFAAFLAILGVLGLARYWAVPAATTAQRRTRDFCEYALLMVSASAIGGVASYATASDTQGFVDPLLAGLDAKLHFNWLAWYQMVIHHPVLQHLGAAAYSSIYVSPVILLGAIAWSGDRSAAQRFLFTYWLAATMTLALFPLFPAKGALEYLWHGPIPYMPTNNLYQGSIIPALRQHTFGEINLGALRGLVCAPSFHTVCATLYIVTAWPMRRLRFVLVPLNVAMLLSTPVEGTHYLSDMLLGFAVALVALKLEALLSTRFCARSGKIKGFRQRVPVVS